MTALAAPVARPKRAAVNVRKRTRFLDLVRDGYAITKAAEQAKIPRRTLYDWRDADAEFAAEWDRAWEQGADVLEEDLLDRTKTSDLLLIFALKGRRPARYRDNVKHEVDARLTVTVSDARAELAARFDQIEQHRQAAIEGKSRQLEPAPASTPSTSVA